MPIAMSPEIGSSTLDLPPENAYAHTKKLRFLLDEIAAFRQRRRRPVTLLDFGCGNGMAVSRYLIEQADRYYGVDIHQPSLEFARERWSQPHAQFLDQVPADIAFDVIVYADILEHLDDPLSFLRAHHEHLQRDGIILGAVPNGYGPFEIENRLARWSGVNAGVGWLRRTKRRLFGQPPPKSEILEYDGEIVPYNSSSGHVQFFTRKSLRRVLERGGFALMELKPAAFLGAPWSARLLLRGKTIIRWNATISDYLPLRMASAWFFAAVKSN
jgi:2-polyprenyl-3-methyl-5-hydroxy-6-metoxy-1,4-benzoquinol methylase